MLSEILILKRKSHSKTINFFARTTIDQEDEYVLFSVKVSLRAIKSLIIFLFFVLFCHSLSLDLFEVMRIIPVGLEKS